MSVCATCGTPQGPFRSGGPGIRICGPVETDPTTGKLVGRVRECLTRRDKADAARENPAA